VNPTADAEQAQPAAATPLVIRPRKIRRVCWALAPATAILFAVLATALTGSTGGDTPGVFQRGDQIAMIVLGLMFAAAILLFTRPRVVADTQRIQVRNVLGQYDVPWEIVRGIVFEQGNPWVSLDLHDDERLAVMAIQAADKEHAVASARALRALFDANRAARA
jgi:hypothetical protein